MIIITIHRIIISILFHPLWILIAENLIENLRNDTHISANILYGHVSQDSEDIRNVDFQRRKV